MLKNCRNAQIVARQQDQCKKWAEESARKLQDLDDFEASIRDGWTWKEKDMKANSTKVDNLIGSTSAPPPGNENREPT